jgi:teichuronic acid biosynthesis glycosyltransferase TuaH
MIGPHSIDQALYDDLAAFPNMRFLGRRNLADLPAYLHHSHCAIIPFKCNDLTKSIYPLKVNEYLAAGLPVVSTAFSEDIQAFSEVVEISESADDFCRRITVAMGNDTEASRHQRVQIASCNTWEDRARRFWDIVTKSAAWSIHSNSIAPMS